MIDKDLNYLFGLIQLIINNVIVFVLKKNIWRLCDNNNPLFLIVYLALSTELVFMTTMVVFVSLNLGWSFNYVN